MLLPAIVTVHALTRRVAEPDLRPMPWLFLGLTGRPRGVALRLAVECPGRAGRLRPAHRPRRMDQPDARTLRRVQAGTGRPTMARRRKLVRNTPPAGRDCLVALDLGWRARVPARRHGDRVPLQSAVRARHQTRADVPRQRIGAAITLTGAAVGFLDLAARARARRPFTAIVAVRFSSAGLASFVAVTRDITRDFEPFGPIVLSHDDFVRTWGPVPPELREYPGAQAGAGRPAPPVAQPARRAAAGQLRRPRTRKDAYRRGLHVDVGTAH